MLEYVNELWQTLFTTSNLGRAQYYPRDRIRNLGSRLDGAENGLLSDQFWVSIWGSIARGHGKGLCQRKAGHISALCTDNTLSKLGSFREFLHAMDPEDMARIIGEQVGFELEHLIDEVMLDRNAVFGKTYPIRLNAEFMPKHKNNCQHTLQELVTELTMNVESLVDMREMVVSQMEADRLLMVRMFLKVGQRNQLYLAYQCPHWDVLWYLPNDSCRFVCAMALDCTILGPRFGAF